MDPAFGGVDFFIDSEIRKKNAALQEAAFFMFIRFRFSGVGLLNLSCG
ncbi:hypothetical protein DFP94_11112 [Fontibacillus phaseoli]|uniref:Uncharacterized protein n=1 Tax=Fontibacillus phaseoli TaxID=1416533 RepID=A0A369B5R8_9BACL|nr:hypothetical protein DFP94_11112 [Fontibacillus phaseoli]